MAGIDYSIRTAVSMIQLTRADGTAMPISFELTDGRGGATRVKIDRVADIRPMAEQRSGMVGDRYECVIEGRTVYLYYGRMSPRTWYVLRQASKEEYEAHYDIDSAVEYH